MEDFIPGQRCISDAELQMGLGTVLSIEGRTITVLFLATGDTRIYSKQTAPLTRVVFSVGDKLQGHDGQSIRVSELREDDGLVTYIGHTTDGNLEELEEGQLDNFIQLNRPSDRLLTGQIDNDKWFELRHQTLCYANRLAHSELRGLTGARTSLIPHQLYIAHEVANRYAPRVLLADEVGLGKTIEAGLILHHQLLTARAQRVLLVLPESLVHQWLVEMLRRFNLHFTIFDEERCQAIEESTDQENPFQSAQLAICSLEFLASNAHRFHQAMAGEWDLLVVDEAHHLAWAPEEVSHEYEVVEQLASQTKGVLLLTATPEQLGKASHFARLRLLDPDRFPDYESFLEEELAYEPIAQAVELLLNGSELSKSVVETLSATLCEGDNRQLLETVLDSSFTVEEKQQARTDLVEHLLDRHGTGRVLYRNTRNAIQGFPERHLHSYPLSLPEQYKKAIAEFQNKGLGNTQLLLSPELLYQALHDEDAQTWVDFDPRVEWLADKLKQLKPEKVLVIASSVFTALDLAETLRQSAGIVAAVFHERLSIVERDRAAANFADTENGCQVMICSEIGSEGRNFQFSHNLILFDLPLNPDLLEQRIGRLDRIGQAQTIHLHVPYLKQSAQAVMTEWYHHGLGAFERTCPAGQSVFVKIKDVLIEALHQVDDGLEDLPALVATTNSLHKELNDALHKGRDKLLEYNSCRPRLAEHLKALALEDDRQGYVFDYMDAVYDCYGVDIEAHGDESDILRAGAQMQMSLTGINEEGVTITYDRDTALANEHMQFLTWDHPLVADAMESVLVNEVGNTAVTSIKCRGIKAGTLVLECLYVLESVAGSDLQASRYLPPTMIRVVMDQNGVHHDERLTAEFIQDNRAIVDIETAGKVIRALSSSLKTLLEQCEAYAQDKAPKFLSEAMLQTKQTLQKEIDRLHALKQINPTVRDDEIHFFESRLEVMQSLLASPALRLDAVRVVIAT